MLAYNTMARNHTIISLSRKVPVYTIHTYRSHTSLSIRFRPTARRTKSWDAGGEAGASEGYDAVIGLVIVPTPADRCLRLMGPRSGTFNFELIHLVQ